MNDWLNDWMLIIFILGVGLPLIIAGFIAMWREHKIKKMNK